jgi:dienelactone hydrolase
MPSGASDIETTLELDAAHQPRVVTGKGQGSTGPLDQRVVFADGTATVTSGTAVQRTPVPPKAAFFAPNTFYLLPFIVARYDVARGGEQQIPVWPLGHVVVAYQGENEVTAAGSSARFDRYQMRIGAQQIALWFDTAGRIAVIGIPAQGFTAAREDLTAWAEPLLRSPAPAPQPQTTTPGPAAVDYAAPPGAPYTAEEVTVPAQGYVLRGTLLVPSRGRRPYPAVVMITGSGQQDRDEALGIPGLERYRPFRQIAETLASAGIAVLRVDDRGAGQSTGAETLPAATTSSFAEDTKLQVTYLRGRSEIDPARIALVGHSEGGIIAPMVAAADPRVAAIALLAGTAKSGGEVSVEQLEALLAHDTTQSAAQKAATLAAQRDVVKRVIAGEDIPGSSNMAWGREYFTYDPLPTIRRVRQPILILQGGRDQQVRAEHATLLATAAREAGNRDVSVHVFPTLNHLFLPSTTGAVAEYSSLKATVLGADVLGTLRDWLVARLRVDR